MSTPVVHSHETISSKNDGTELFVQTWQQPSTAATTMTTAGVHLLILHGYLEHSARYREMAESLITLSAAAAASASSTGVGGVVVSAVTAYDFRGHGKSGGAYRGVCSSFNDYYDDFESVLQHVTDKYHPTTVYLFAHSNGALTLSSYLFLPERSAQKQVLMETYKVQGVILTSPWLAPAQELPVIKIWASKLLGRCRPSLMLASDLPVAHLTRDIAKQQEHEADPLILKKLTLGWAYQSLQVQARMMQLTAADCVLPMHVLFVIGGKDRVASPTVNTTFAQEKVSVKDGCTKIVEVRADAEHEVWNEIDRNEVYEIILSFLQKTKTATN